MIRKILATLSSSSYEDMHITFSSDDAFHHLHEGIIINDNEKFSISSGIENLTAFINQHSYAENESNTTEEIPSHHLEKGLPMKFSTGTLANSISLDSELNKDNQNNNSTCDKPFVAEDTVDLPLLKDLINEKDTEFEQQSISELPSTDISHIKLKQYSLSLDKILLETSKRKHRLEDELMRATPYENSLFSASDLSSENYVNSILEEQTVQLMLFKGDRISQPPLGMNIFNRDKYFCFFKLKHLHLNSCGFDKISAPAWEQQLMDFPSSELPSIIFDLPVVHLSQLSNKNAILLFLFKFIALCEDVTAVDVCLESICHFIHMSHTACIAFNWCPPFEEILAILINYGAVPDDNCPLKKALLFTKAKLKESVTFNIIEKENGVSYCKINLINRLNVIIHALTLLIDSLCNYKDIELYNIIILLSWITLDSELLCTSVRKRVESCVSASLQKISSSHWQEMHERLTNTLSKLGGHHKNILLVAQQLPSGTPRCLQLQKSVSFLAVQAFLNVERPYFVSLIKPTDVVNLLENRLLFYVDDVCLLHTIILLVELCIGCKVQAEYKNTLKKLCKIIMDSYGKIKESYRNPETLQVKQTLVNLNCKWNTICNCLPEERRSSRDRCSTQNWYI